MWDLQKSLSRAGHRGLRAERRKNRHFNVYAVPAVRGDVPLRRLFES